MLAQINWAYSVILEAVLIYSIKYKLNYFICENSRE